MIGLDLDGTLLTDRKEITPRTRRVISRAIEEGVVVLVATGRPWMGVPEELREELSALRDEEEITDPQYMVLAVEYEDGTVFRVKASGLLSQVLPDEYDEVREMLLSGEYSGS